MKMIGTKVELKNASLSIPVIYPNKKGKAQLTKTKSRKNRCFKNRTYHPTTLFLTIMNILIACDSFKDALDAAAVCQAIERGLRFADPSVSTRIFPLADGGEGMSAVLNAHLGLTPIEVEVLDPLFRKINATYHITTDGQTAFIEMAQAAGLQLLTMDERNPLKTTTFGVGQMIVNAIKNEVKHIILGIGGSATNDAGIGMASALGWKFLDKNKQKLLPIGENLSKINKIMPRPHANFLVGGGKWFLFKSLYNNITFEVVCDVTNPLFGHNGAAYRYAEQKGGTAESIKILDDGLRVVNDLFHQTFHTAGELSNSVGAGAAGGLGFGALAFLNATIKSGINALMDLTNFDTQATWADVIITGEGRLDSQTADGKLIAGIVARSQGKPVIALCGAVEAPPQYLRDLGLKAAFSIAQKPCTLPEALAATAENLEKTAFNIGQLLFFQKESAKSSDTLKRQTLNYFFDFFNIRF
jgi:glycerate 2-kinase